MFVFRLQGEINENLKELLEVESDEKGLIKRGGKIFLEI